MGKLARVIYEEIFIDLVNMKLLISPHPDDAILFSTYNILRENLTVVSVTFPTLQGDNGLERILEDYMAMQILDRTICYLHIPEHELTDSILYDKLYEFYTEDLVYIPEYQKKGNPQHNIVNRVAKTIFPNVKEYKTYSGLEDRTIGEEIIPTVSEFNLKIAALNCYQTQINNPNTKHYFSTTSEYE